MRLDELTVGAPFFVTTMPELQGTLDQLMVGCAMVRWIHRNAEPVTMEGENMDGEKWTRTFTPKAGGRPVSISRGTEVTPL